MSTLFNGASSVAQVGRLISFRCLTRILQQGGIAALDNINQVMDIVKYYLANAKLVREVDREDELEGNVESGGREGPGEEAVLLSECTRLVLC